MNIITILSIILIVPVYSLCQNHGSENLYGTIIIEKKPVDFTFLHAPDGTTEISCFNHLPSGNEYTSTAGKEIISLHDVKKIEITRLNKEELQFVHDSLSGCTLYKATITFNDKDGKKERSVYLAFKYFIWGNTGSGEFQEPREAELRYVDAVCINTEVK